MAGQMERREGSPRHIRVLWSMNLSNTSGDFGAGMRCSRLDFGQARGRIVPLELADEHVFIGKEMIQRAHGNLGTAGGFIDDKRFDTLPNVRMR
ncbi:hypothetical protein [Corynebacterium macginleyi]|uniref:hypothetical protein n=1 Tax=Corynebacterium macginleyi TaxID=38290 RepID=UPI001909A8D5|nr:hypothetical protein [Corynebacterium macginleyi]MBK4138458.1 hypothetical protein [Corynebacterium macginleyi]MBM0262435.1 hypothetical protein [Corynebacterium macginleyi]